MKTRLLTTMGLSFAVMAVLLLMPSSASCQTGYDDVIYLKDGSIIRGVIVEQIPGTSVKLRSKDGSIFVFKSEDIKRIAKEESIGEASQPTGQKIGSKKEPAVAFLLSLIVPGAGQFYNGENGKGALLLGTAAVGLTLFFAFEPLYDEKYNPETFEWEDTGSPEIAYPGLGLAIAAGLWSMIDAPMNASRINSENGWAKSNEKPKVYVSISDLSQGREVSPGLKFSIIF